MTKKKVQHKEQEQRCRTQIGYERTSHEQVHVLLIASDPNTPCPHSGAAPRSHSHFLGHFCGEHVEKANEHELGQEGYLNLVAL